MSFVPPPGSPLTFEVWSTAIVAGVRVFLPGLQAVRKGHRIVILRDGQRSAQLYEQGETFWIRFLDADSTTTLSSMYDDRRDNFTTANFARSIAGFFDARFTRVDLL